MANSVGGSVGRIIDFCLPDVVYQIGQAAIIIEEVAFSDFTTLGCPGKHHLGEVRGDRES